MASQSGQLIDFSTVLASAVHDMKSSLNLLQQSIDSLNATVSDEDTKTKTFLSTAHYESARLNTGLVQLLSLYRAEMENLPIHEDECHIEDLIDNMLLTHQGYFGHKNLTFSVEQAPGLVRYLDEQMVTLLLNDILVNAMRYGQSRLLLSAYEQDGWLIISIEDDGPGYPKDMLQASSLDMRDIVIREGRTGLGLFFARAIAAAHHRGERKGEINLSNGGKLGGSVFTLKLP
ncbi:HAMP domain-containing sensor histidine kinase [Aliiglaciecola sp. LCG003]|uniref:sensor histidine kinase n=1 Tax=Aliiglaciecola sp. LCG003 TaxID=3053655 RepID=UPI0025723241|nr:HAMP domain-containing sensor histidine kinase [Aliiglaciecola sp. LCG003]WJG11009.1 HAMP domain-containing sensor histidine kinase [Aliiglaciecola sp. LCG003]